MALRLPNPKSTRWLLLPMGQGNLGVFALEDVELLPKEHASSYRDRGTPSPGWTTGVPVARTLIHAW